MVEKEKSKRKPERQTHFNGKINRFAFMHIPRALSDALKIPHRKVDVAVSIDVIDDDTFKVTVVREPEPS